MRTKYVPEFSLGKALFMRFIRGFVAGAFSTMVMINISGVSTFGDLKVFLSALGLSAIIGGISGAIQAVDKFIRS